MNRSHFITGAAATIGAGVGVGLILREKKKKNVGSTGRAPAKHSKPTSKPKVEKKPRVAPEKKPARVPAPEPIIRTPDATVMSYNIRYGRGAGSDRKWRKRKGQTAREIVEIIHNSGTDIITLQETRAFGSNPLRVIQGELRDMYDVYSFGTQALLVRRDTTDLTARPMRRKFRRSNRIYIRSSVKVGDRDFVVYQTHLTRPRRRGRDKRTIDELFQLGEAIERRGDHKRDTIVSGDFNLEATSIEAAFVYLNQLKLNGQQHTFPTSYYKDRRFDAFDRDEEIDQMFVTERLAGSARVYTADNVLTASDHFPIIGSIFVHQQYKKEVRRDGTTL